MRAAWKLAWRDVRDALHGNEGRAWPRGEVSARRALVWREKRESGLSVMDWAGRVGEAGLAGPVGRLP